MREYSIRSSQLRELKLRFIIKVIIYVLINVLLYIIPNIISISLFIYLNNGGDFNNYLNVFANLIIPLILFLVLTFVIFIPSTILIIYMYVNDNKYFHNKYLQYLIEECRLNDIYYKFRKKSFDKNLYSELEEYLNICEINRIYELSDISSMKFIEFNQIQYIKNKKKHNGVIILLRNTEPLDGFFQIRTNGEPLKDNYEGKSILRFGFQKNIPSFEIYSSLGSVTYSLNNKDFENLMNKFKKYIRCNFVVTRCNTTISIFLETFQFNLTSGLLSKYHEKDFDAKVDSLIHLHELTNEIINALMSLNV